MKSKIITIGTTFLLGSFIGLKGIFETPKDEHTILLFENIEALAKKENEEGIAVCMGNGSIKCPQEGRTGDFVRYLSLRDKVSLY